VSAAPVAFLLIAGLCLVLVPRRIAALPLLLAALYTTRIPVIELGPANLSVLRVLVLIGLVRAAARREWTAQGWNAIDTLLLAWATLLIASSAFHTPDAWTFRLGMMLGELGVYFLCRVFLQDAADVRRTFTWLCIALAPLAVLMLLEKFTAQTYFAGMGGVSDVTIRNGYVRAAGPFAHPILAGTVGASFVPIALYLWTDHRMVALIGFFGALAIVFASTSSGPVLMVAAACAGILAWNIRAHLRFLRWGALAVLILLQLVMHDPVYFLVARIDIAGGSTGWFRAQLIRSSLQHLSEWWAVGTDYTRHWMPTGIPANGNHTDMTNHLLALGVMGGLPVAALFVAALWTAFRAVGRAVCSSQSLADERGYLAWTLGATLFGHLVNLWSISLYDQSISFLYLILASIGAVHVRLVAELPSTADSARVLSRQVTARRWRWQTAPVRPTSSPAAAYKWRRHGPQRGAATASLMPRAGAGSRRVRPLDPRR